MSAVRGAALSVAVAVFLLYHSTLLPGLDFGDTGSFQATVGSRVITPRDGYPLYFAIGNLLLLMHGGEPAHVLNLASAIEGAAAASLIVVAASELSGAAWAGAAAALFFAGSYTFWSQATIAEVYALHALFMSLTLWLLLRWHRRPTTARLALFFATYALGFGNHLSMVLLLPAYAVFLLTSAPDGWRSMLRPTVVALAATLAALGALQYVWNLRELWRTPHPPHTLAEALGMFWFDVTKSDWRETMVGRVPPSMLGERMAMFAFDLRQQFGWVVPALACAGLARLWSRSWRIGLLMLVLYASNATFAFLYNVGDTHVFILPAHLLVALLSAPGLVLVASLSARPFQGRARGRAMAGRPVAAIATASLALAYASARIYRDYPVLDRSGDRRPTEVLQAMTAGIDDQHAILLTDLNWQIQNGLSYFSKTTKPDLADARMPDVLLFAPALVRDNQAIGREVALTERAAADLTGAFGPLFSVVVDRRVEVPSLTDVVSHVPPGTRYVLSVLKSSRDLPLDERDLASAARLLGINLPEQRGDYFVLAGISGEAPALVVGADRPFTRQVTLQGTPVDVRIESWLAFDTIRRMGFGHAIAARRHTLIIERGISFAAFDSTGRPVQTAYRSNIYAPQRRYLISRKHGV